MTQRLQEVLEKASALPETVQEQLAEQLVEDIEAEMAWDRTLASSESQELLDRMAEVARKAHEQGKTREMGFDEL